MQNGSTGNGDRKKKWLHGKGGIKTGSSTPIVPGATPTGLKLKIKQPGTGTVETKVLPPKSVGMNGVVGGGKRDESESSQTLSSPN
jgi:hypothetical protein